MKTYSVTYEVTTIEEAVFQSKNEKSAIKHVQEVLGDVKITDIVELDKRRQR